MALYNARIKLQYLIYGTGIFVSFMQCSINWNQKALLRSLPIFIVTLSVSNIIFLYILFKTEQKWDLKLSRKPKFWQMRPAADNGIWLATLFPLTLLASSLTHVQTASPIYVVTTTLTLGYMVSSLLGLHKLVGEDSPSLKLCFCLQLPISLITAVFLHHSLSLSIWVGFIISVLSQMFFLTLTFKLVLNFPHSFTVGEVLTVSEMVAALISTSALALLNRVFYFLCKDGIKCYNGAKTTQFVQVLAVGSGIIVAALSLRPLQRFFKKSVPFHSLCVITGAFVVYPMWFFFMSLEPFTWLLYFCLRRKLLIGYWISCVLVAVSIVAWRNRHGMHATSAVRKYFHAIVILIYLPGLFWDREMLFLGSGVALFVFFAVEMIRVLEVPPLGRTLDSVLRIFLDEKDAGNLIITHTYLLVGCSFPLWILPSHSGKFLATISGILSLGFGDTVASLGGSMWGLHKLPDSMKSVEGTLCAIIVQLFVTIAICFYAHLVRNALDIFHICFATILCCGLEAFTNQIDNLVLPMFLYLMLVAL